MKNRLFRFVHFITQYIQQTAIARSFQRRFPRLYQFVYNRFITYKFSGLPLTSMLLLLGVQLIVLSELAEDVMESEEIVQLDKQFTHFLYEVRHPIISKIFYGLTQLGTRPAIFAFGGLASLILAFRKRYLAIICFWATMGGIGLSVVYGKKFISRARPEEVGYYLETNMSFPSGHATTAMALFGFLTYFVLRYAESWPYRVLLVMFSFLLILLIGFSRVYLGVHFLSDVLAGMLVGSAWVIVGITVLEYFSEQKAATLNKKINDES